MTNNMGRAIGLKPIALSAGLTVLSMAAIWALLNLLGPDWSLYAPASCIATRCFCELPRVGSFVLQPANSWSSYGYAFVGFLMILLAQQSSWKSRFRSEAATAFGLTAIFVGLGSVLLHATLTLWGQFFDVMGMYLTGSFMLVSALSRWRRLPPRLAIVLYLLLVSGLLVILYEIPDVRRWLFAVILVAAIAIELGFARPRRAACGCPIILRELRQRLLHSRSGISTSMARSVHQTVCSRGMLSGICLAPHPYGLHSFTIEANAHGSSNCKF